MKIRARISGLFSLFGLVWLIASTVTAILYRIATSKPFGEALAACGAMMALLSGWFWYLSAKGALVPHPPAMLARLDNLYNYWAGGLSAASAACVALALLCRKD